MPNDLTPAERHAYGVVSRRAQHQPQHTEEAWCDACLETARAVVAAVRPIIEADWNDPLGDETEPAHSIQVGAHEPEGLSCICGFTPRGDGTHALTNHLMDVAAAEALDHAANAIDEDAAKRRADVMNGKSTESFEYIEGIEHASELIDHRAAALRSTEKGTPNAE